MDIKVRLIDHTPDPIATIWKIWQASRNNEPFEKIEEEYQDHLEEARALFQQIVASDIPVAQAIHFTFLLEGVSISFREQMVRHKVGSKVNGQEFMDLVPDQADSSWWSQSMRILPMDHFADQQLFRIPPSISENRGKVIGIRGEPRGMLSAWLDHMQRSQELYANLVAAGIAAEEARDCLPLACQHRITWSLNLATLSHVIAKRSCWILQLGLWGPVIHGMMKELVELDPAFAVLSRPPCVKVTEKGEQWSSCPFSVDIDRRLKGEDPLPPCPIHFYNTSTPHTSIFDDNLERKERPYSIGKVAKAADEWQAAWGRSPITGLTLKQ